LLVLKALSAAAAPRARSFQPHQPDHERHVRCETGLVVSGAAPDGGSRLVEGEWGESENNRRAKFYSLTKAGRRQLEHETEDWQRIALAMTNALRAS
jgi:hypothetical protein